jgi:hypothetical protein
MKQPNHGIIRQWQKATDQISSHNQGHLVPTFYNRSIKITSEFSLNQN